MNKKILAILMAGALVFSASTALAGDVDMDGDGNIGIGIDNNNTNTALAEANAQQEQNQEQQQRQTLNFNNVREHITALPGPVGSFVAAPTTLVGNWTPFLGSPLFASFSAERIRSMSASDSFWGGVKIEKVIHVPYNGNGNDQSGISLIGWDVREGAYSTDQLLGEFQCQGEYGIPMGASLGRCLEEAKKETGTKRVFAAYKLRRDPKNSGFSIGSGVGGSALAGSPDDKAAAIALGGLIGTTRAKIDEAYDWTILALNDGPLTRATGPTSCVKPPVATPATCDPSPIWAKIKELERKIKSCLKFCFNNLVLRAQIGEAYVDLYVCTGNSEHLRSAINHFEIAERNYLRGYDIKAHQAETDKIIQRVHWVQAGCIYLTQGAEAANAFAAKHHIERYPTRFAQ